MPVIPAEYSDSPRRSVWREHRKMILFCGGLLLLLALFGLWRWVLTVRVEAALNEIRARGEPVVLEDLLARLPPMPPPTENAAEFYRRAAAVYRQPSLEKFDRIPLTGIAELPSDTEPLSPQMLADIEIHVTENSACLELLRQGTECKQCRYTPDGAKIGLTLADTPLSELRRCVSLLCLEAVVHSEHHQTDEAVESLRQAWQLSESLGEESMIVTFLVQITMHRQIVDSLARVMNRIPLPDAVLARFIEMMNIADDEIVLSRCMLCERMWGIEIYGHPDTYGVGGVPSDPARYSLKGYAVVGLWSVDELNYLAGMADMIQASRQPFAARYAAMTAVEAGWGKRQIWTNLISRLITPPLCRFALLDGRAVTKVRCAILAMAVERHRLAHGGALPTDLNQLVPVFIERIPEDPFTGKPLIFKPLAKGFTVYSVGEDLHDDGGAKTNSAGKEFEPGTDIPFTVAR